MKTSQEHINNLYTFTREHFVMHYDLQTELVDHLANDIESIWSQNPNLSFTEARDKAFKKFGIFGFMDVIEKREKAMRKRYIGYLWHEFKTWFTLPKLIITLTVFMVLFIGFSTSFAQEVLLVSYGLLTAWCIYKGMLLQKQYKRRQKETHKKWMLEELIFKQAGGSSLILISQLPSWYNLSDGLFGSQVFILAVSVVTTLFVIWMYASFELLPNKSEELLHQTYPEFSL
ncbi:MAG: hypothetical protein WA775_09395 [Psychroserpens sp.]|uniref:hypothetical protein n=1 Tax=Psychroserpens sp. TaxID=2020870 RepID=UPI003CBF6869